MDALLHGQVEEVLPVVEEEEEEKEGEGCHSSTLPFATTSTLLSQLASGTGGLQCPVSLIEIVVAPVLTETVHPSEVPDLPMCTEAKVQLGLDCFKEPKFSFQTDNLDNGNSFEPED